MKTWLKYLLIFAVIFAIIGYLLGPVFYIAPECPNDPITGELAPCMGDPSLMRIPIGIAGLIIGAVIGLVIGKIKSKNAP